MNPKIESSLCSNAEILVLMIRTNVGRLQQRQSIDTILLNVTNKYVGFLYCPYWSKQIITIDKQH